MSVFRTAVLCLLATLTLAQQTPPPSQQEQPAAKQGAAAGGTMEKPPPEAAGAVERESKAERVKLNLLGETDAASGESRRNENVQFNLVDNNALKELNVRLGTTATIIREFRPDRSYFGAEFGSPPSDVLQAAAPVHSPFHGNLFYMHQNSVFSARSFFQVGDVKPARENHYGFQFGATIKPHTYFSIQASQDKLRGSVNGNVLVPMPDERTPLTTDPQEWAMIARFLAAYPDELPNRTDINPRALNTNASQIIDNNRAEMRLEQDIGAADRLILQYGFVSQSVDAFQLVAGQNPDTDTKSHLAHITWRHQWSPRTLTEFSAGFDRIGSLLVPEENAVGPMVVISGLTALGPAGSIPIDRAHNMFRYAGSIEQTRRRHTLTAGFSLLRRQFNGVETDVQRGFYGFSNDFGRSGIENLRYGKPSQYIVTLGDMHRGFRNWDMQFYAGDNWKVTPKLNFQLGLRYRPVTRPVEVNGLNKVAYDSDLNNFAPQFGFAYRLPSRLGVIRGAYGLHYGQIFPVTFSQIRYSPPGAVKLAVPAPDLIDPLGLDNPDGPPTNALGNRYLLDPELALPYSHQYNFSWESELFHSWRLQLGYVGSRSHKLLIMWYRNRAHPVEGIPQTTATINERRPIPNLAEIRWVLNGSRGYFDAARVSLIAPRWKGLTLDVSYWFSKAMDLGASYTNTAYDSDSRLSRSQWEYETHKDRKALSSFDQPHAFLARTSYEFPVIRRLGWFDNVAGGWIVSAVVLLKKGTPFAVGTFDGPGYGNVDGNGGDRPNLRDPSILGRTIGNPDTSVAMLPREAFYTMEPTDPAGNLGVNVFRKGGIANVNAALSRTWKITTRTSLRFRAESINLGNTPQFAAPGYMFGAGNFGYITNTLNDGRTFRLSLQFNW